jgi:hypothetical protein
MSPRYTCFVPHIIAGNASALIIVRVVEHTHRSLLMLIGPGSVPEMIFSNQWDVPAKPALHVNFNSV